MKAIGRIAVGALVLGFMAEGAAAQMPGVPVDFAPASNGISITALFGRGLNENSGKANSVGGELTYGGEQFFVVYEDGKPIGFVRKMKNTRTDTFPWQAFRYKNTFKGDGTDEYELLGSTYSSLGKKLVVDAVATGKKLANDHDTFMRESVEEAASKFPVKCMECGKKFKTASMLPTCPKCKGSDVEPDYDAPRARKSYRESVEEDCASALVMMVDLAARAENVLVDRQRSDCKPAATESVVFANADDAKSSLANAENFVLIDSESPRPDFMQAAHDERLSSLKTCEETNGAAPCKIGEIILEAPADSGSAEIWRREK